MMKCRYRNIKDCMCAFLKEKRNKARFFPLQKCKKYVLCKKRTIIIHDLRGLRVHRVPENFASSFSIIPIILRTFGERDIIILFHKLFLILFLIYIYLASSDFLFWRLLEKTWRSVHGRDDNITRREQRPSLRKNRRHRQSAMLPWWRCIYFLRHRSGKLLLSPASADVILSQADARDLLPLHAMVQTDSAIEKLLY